MARIPAAFVPLHVSYAHDRDIARAGEAAELLYVRGIAYSKREKTAGVIPDYDLSTVGVRLSRIRQRANRLVECELWEVIDGGWRIRSWERWNESDEEMRDRLERDRKRKANKPKADGNPDGVPTDSARNDAGIQTESDRIPLLETEKKREETEETVHAETDVPATKPRATRIPDDWHVDETLTAWATDQGLTAEQIRFQNDQFVDHWKAKAGKDAACIDWASRWRKWIRNAKQWGNVTPITTPAGITPPAGKATCAHCRDTIAPYQGRWHSRNGYDCPGLNRTHEPAA